jgi:hypothetical protein
MRRDRERERESVEERETHRVHVTGQRVSLLRRSIQDLRSHTANRPTLASQATVLMNITSHPEVDQLDIELQMLDFVLCEDIGLELLVLSQGVDLRSGHDHWWTRGTWR